METLNRKKISGVIKMNHVICSNKATQLLLGLFILGICSCVPYGVDNRPAPICAVETKLSAEFIYKNYDSIASCYSWNSPPVEWESAFKIIDDEQIKDRVFYLSGDVPEMYYVQFTEPIQIKAIFNGRAYKEWTYGKNIKEEEKNRICERFKEQVLKKME